MKADCYLSCNLTPIYRLETIHTTQFIVKQKCIMSLYSRQLRAKVDENKILSNVEGSASKPIAEIAAEAAKAWVLHSTPAAHMVVTRVLNYLLPNPLSMLISASKK